MRLSHCPAPRKILLGIVAAVLLVPGSGSTAPTADPASTGFNGKIAFDTRRAEPGSPGPNAKIYVMNGDGSSPTRLTDGSHNDDAPAWSPDGTRIAFTRAANSGPDTEVFVMNADGSGQRNLSTAPAAYDFWPDWSPDGAKIAFSSYRGAAGDSEIFVMNADGSGQTNLTNHPRDDYWPAWSPDGTKIAFTSHRSAPGDADIVVMDADGSNAITVTDEPAESLFVSWENAPAWSPDGSKIAFVRWPATGGADDVFVMNADGSGQKNVTNHAANDFYPEWSPDGTKITFTSDRSGNREIYVMNADGSNPANVSNNAADDTNSDWQALAAPPPAPDSPPPGPPRGDPSAGRHDPSEHPASTGTRANDPRILRNLPLRVDGTRLQIPVQARQGPLGDVQVAEDVPQAEERPTRVPRARFRQDRERGQNAREEKLARSVDRPVPAAQQARRPRAHEKAAVSSGFVQLPGLDSNQQPSG